MNRYGRPPRYAHIATLDGGEMELPILEAPERKMSTETLRENAERSTTLQLAPIVGATTFHRDQLDVVVVEDYEGVAMVMAGKIGDYVMAHLGREPHVWHRDGTPVSGHCALLAWRTHEGAWGVVDSRVSTLLPKIDQEIEP